MRHLLAKLLPSVFVLLVLTPQALATWSIVVINHKTREVAVATATCLPNDIIRNHVPVISVGKGAAAAQSFVLFSGQNRMRIFDGLQNGLTPAEILADLEANDNGHQSRQYGIVNFDGPPVTFSGSLSGAAACQLVGQIGDYSYAIQGNVLTGFAVCLDIEFAFLTTPGDLSQKLMASMEAARRRGGDGRCSCLTGTPTACGAPPAQFDKSAHTGTVLVARLGDLDAPCNGSAGGGCARGDYYLEIEATGTFGAPDPVFVLQQQYDTWRAGKVGLIDQLQSRVSSTHTRLVADGATATDVVIEVFDLNGDAVNDPGIVFQVTRTEGDPVAVTSPVTHLGNNRYGFTATSTLTFGRGQWTVVASQAGESVQLHPALDLVSQPVDALRTLRWELSAGEGGTVGAVLNAGAGAAGEPYHLYASLAGNAPGTVLGSGLLIPLNRDRLFELTELQPGHPSLSGFIGMLDGTGRAEAVLQVAPGAFATQVGTRLDLCATTGSSGATQVTNLAGLWILP